MDLKALIAHKSPLIMDGAMGTEIFKRITAFSGCIELLNLEKPDVVLAIHRSYIDAGADIIQTNTFGATPLKLGDYGLEGQSAEINRRAAGIAREAARGSNVIVAGTLGPTGRLIEPVGPLASERAYEAYFSQAKSLAAGGVDILTVETMTDIKEARLALIAAKDATALPVICSMSFGQNGKTVSGTGMLTAFATLAQCGADVVGANCGMGPEGLLRLYRDNWDDLLAVGAPFSVWSNAGMPEIVNGEVVYRLGPQEFAHTSAQMASLGLSVVGGCCGTSPAHIAALRSMIEVAPAARQFDQRYRFITSRVAALDLQGRDTILLVGERLNPTARKKFAEDLKQGKTAFLRDESRAQEAEGAHLLDINVGVPGIDEVAAMKSSLLILDGSVRLPLMIDSDNRDVLEAALMNCPGVPVINSINGKKKSLESVLPLVKRFGAFIVALCMDETGIHRNAEKRIGIGERMLELLESEGVARERVFIDPLILAESAEPGSARETLKVIRHFASSGVKTSIGLSNISFGLPQRKFVNNAFLNMAIAEGLAAAIVNPSAARIRGDAPEEERYAVDFLEGKDEKAARYIQHFAGAPSTEPVAKAEAGGPGIESIYRMVLEGRGDVIGAEVREALRSIAPEAVMNDGLLKALERVGELYSTGEYFLPQMIASAEAMKTGFAVLKPLLRKESVRKAGKVVICTVRGDVHDIGKNIVAMMMENYGFEVLDLGKDVPADEIIRAAKEHGVDIVALSSLLTTTMGEMKIVRDMMKKDLPGVGLLVGGAVVTPEYAESLGAGYGADAVEGVKAALRYMEGK